MKNPIKRLEIKNFKTVKNVAVDCKRINLIIGKPNVGKSNILEGLSLLGGTYSTKDQNYFSEFIRYDRIEDLFFDKETGNEIVVSTNIGAAIVREHRRAQGRFEYILLPKMTKANLAVVEEAVDGRNYDINEKNIEGPQSQLPFFHLDLGAEGLKIAGPGPLIYWHSPVKKYEFRKSVDIKNRFHFFLLPPDGNNLYTIVNRNKKFFSQIASFFKDYKLQFKLIPRTTEFLLQKDVKGVIYEYQYNLIADTLQRMIFNLMAIESNKDSVLVFEEPESHMFPPYVKRFAETVIESPSNQFFIATHSPFLLNTVIENTDLEEVAVFVATYENFQTKLKPLSKRELEEMLSYGNDIFFSEKLNG